MDLNKVNIEKLPADVRRVFKQLQVLHAEKKIQNKAKNDFISFVKCMWPDFVEGSHHRHIAEKFNKLAFGFIILIISELIKFSVKPLINGKLAPLNKEIFFSYLTNL